MRLLKWLLLQTLQTRITYSKKEGDIAFFFFVIIPRKSGNEISKCCQNVAKIGVWRKRKTPKSLFYNNLGVLFSGATGK